MTRSRSTSLLLVLAIALAWGTTIRPIPAWADQGVASAIPQILILNHPTQLTVTVPIMDPLLIRGSVNLQQLDATGRAIAVLGTLNDDGQDGDGTPGNQVFTIQVALTANSTDPVNVRASWALKGTLERVVSNTVSLAVVEGTTQMVDETGGAVTGADGTQLVIPPGGLTSSTPIGLRSASFDEVHATVGRDFSGQKLTFVGAVQIETGGAPFVGPVTLSIPNTKNLPSDAQVLLAQVVSDVTGNGTPDLVLVDSASVVDGQVRDGALGRGVPGGGVYVFLQAKPPVQLITATVTDAEGIPIPNARAASIDFPDLLSKSDDQGHVVLAVPGSAQTTSVIAANEALTSFSFAPIFPNPGNLVPGIPSLPTLDPLLCQHPPNPTDDVLNAIARQLATLIQAALGSRHVDLALSQDLILVGQTTTATVDVGKFVAAVTLGTQNFIVSPVQRLHTPFGSSIAVNAVRGLTNILIAADLSLTSSNPAVAPSPTFLTPSGSTNPQFQVQGSNVGITQILGTLNTLTLTVTARLETEQNGMVCEPLFPQLTVRVDLISSGLVGVSPVDLQVGAANYFGSSTGVINTFDSDGNPINVNFDESVGFAIVASPCVAGPGNPNQCVVIGGQFVGSSLVIPGGPLDFTSSGIGSITGVFRICTVTGQLAFDSTSASGSFNCINPDSPNNQATGTLNVTLQ